MTTKTMYILAIILTMASCNSEPKKVELDRIPKYKLKFDQLATTWDEAIPLGNGTVGALVWQKDGKLRLSLDRADLWDLRPMENLNFKDFGFDWVKEQWEKNTYNKVQERYDVPYDNLPAPSKIPGGALEFDVSGLGEVESVKLNLDSAICEVKWKNGALLKTFVHASEPIGWYSFENISGDLDPSIIPPAYVSVKQASADNPVTGQDLRRLNYDGGKVTQKDHYITYDQKGWSDFKFQVHTQWKPTPTGFQGSWSISSQTSEKEPEETAEQVVTKSLEQGIESSMKSHIAWWISFWNKSTIKVPDPVLQNQWYMEMYKLGSAARQGAPPISLQSVWTADNGKLPPWKGDFHHDLNTQLSYWPTYSGNHLDLEQGFIDWLTQYKPTFKKYTKDFYGTNGLNVPGVTTLTGDPMGGWIQYSFGPTVGAWLGQHFYLHWRYSMDRDFLKNEAYPWIKEVAIHFNELSVLDEKGKRKLPLSSSPEIHNNSREAWFGDMTNFDLALIKWTYSHAAELALELGLKDEAEKWNASLKEWPDYAMDETGLMFSPSLTFNESHRHFSHLMAIHPLGLIDVANGAKDKEIIEKTIANLDATGSSEWVGYSFSWLANLKARAYDGEGAAKALKDFATSFVLPNSFHVNGDQSGTGKSNFTYRPFTLEGNFAYAAGLQEMLIQSHTETIQLFPAIPNDWKNASFSKLRTEGAFLVSAQKDAGVVKWVKIVSEKGGEIRLKNPFQKKEISIGDKINHTWDGDTLIIQTDPGQEIWLKP
ncbi:glycoside hydrolase N-terminal domain-containing protein [Arenibacter sp. BSSL-BM3]|uniref:Glycoside hydrolase N-terminal domain-containing protein n=1 Tax=Arenibacter arenosicollis TaxID=2762274 RepID=A0ABR7QJF7_9FLAO|nr:glycoside hydrolase N-terminal domain-containing protein [Arenibacter arenosicollis]MBC8767317.1 glycoside hydrolase N-terminal domain-containing protein [Arenibacter arenosicollis]